MHVIGCGWRLGTGGFTEDPLFFTEGSLFSAESLLSI
jgi:hypothetical protein